MKLWHSFKKELKLASKGFYFYIELFMALIILVVLLFAVPEQVTSLKTEYVTLDLPPALHEMYMQRAIDNDLDHKLEDVEIKSGSQVYKAKLFQDEDKKAYLLESEDAVKKLSADKNQLGAVVTTSSDGSLFYRYHLQGYESQRYRNALLLVHVKDLDLLKGSMDKQEVVALNANVTELNDRQNSVPSLLVFNGSLMGFFVIAAYIFLDKKEGVIKAYAVTASSVWQYLMSKVGVILVTTILSSLIVVAPIMGLQPNYLLLIMFLLTTGFFASSLGLLLASFYDNIMQSFGAMYTLMMLLIVPSFSYFIASWQPTWVKFIPTYTMIQGFKEIMINGDVNYVLISSLGFLVGGLLLFLLANKRYKKTLTV